MAGAKDGESETTLIGCGLETARNRAGPRSGAACGRVGGAARAWGYFAQVSRSVMVRLNTGRPGALSRESTAK